MTTHSAPNPPTEDPLLALIQDYIRRLQQATTINQADQIGNDFESEELIINFRGRVHYFKEALREARISLQPPPLPPEEVRILFASANPSETRPLPLDQELRDIQERVRAARFRDSLKMHPTPAARFKDLVRALNDHAPHIVHFTGHGQPTEGILLVDGRNNPKPVSTASLVRLFESRRGTIRLVVLNACYSTEQANAITSVIDCVIGMNTKISSGAAITFVGAFYEAIGFTGNVQAAFDDAKAILGDEAPNEADIPQLLHRPDVNPANIRLITPPQRS